MVSMHDHRTFPDLLSLDWGHWII